MSSTPKTRPQCSHIKGNGEQCKGYARHGMDVCMAHSPDMAAARAKAVQASAQARRGKVEARQEAQEAAKLSLTERIRLEAGRRNEELARALVAAALADPHGRAMAHVLDRVEGKVADKLETTTATANPFEMDEAQLLALLAAADEADAEERVLRRDPS